MISVPVSALVQDAVRAQVWVCEVCGVRKQRVYHDGRQTRRLSARTCSSNCRRKLVSAENNPAYIDGRRSDWRRRPRNCKRLNDKQLSSIRAWWAIHPRKLTADQMAAQLGVATATLYRHKA